MEDIFIACTDNLTGFSAAIGAVFPKTEIQNCIIHQLRNSSKYVSYKDIKALMADLRSVYAAVDEPTALDALASITSPKPTSVSTKIKNGRSMPGIGRNSFFILSPLPFSVRSRPGG